MCPALPCKWRAKSDRPRGFTLVELLVVIGIIALLISILLPALSRAREEGKRINCLSQIRQIGMAFSMYADVNKDYFPYASSTGGGHRLEDFIYWQQGPPLQDITQSAVAPFLGRTQISMESMFRCPSDSLGRKAAGAGGPYFYSFSMNHRMASNGSPVLKRAAIRSSSEKILLIEESENTIDDGRWVWPGNYLSTWHDSPSRQNTDNARGNAVFVDSHAEFITRAMSNDVWLCDPSKQR